MADEEKKEAAAVEEPKGEKPAEEAAPAEEPKAEEPAKEEAAGKPKAAKAETAEKPAPAKSKKSGSINNIMAAIKEMNVMELAELVKALEEEFGVSAAAPVAMAAAPVAAAAADVEEQTEFTVILQEFGANKINVIKAVRELTSLGLKESKDLVEGAPQPVREGITKEEAANAKQKLEAAGATVQVK